MYAICGNGFIALCGLHTHTHTHIRTHTDIYKWNAFVIYLMMIALWYELMSEGWLLDFIGSSHANWALICLEDVIY